MNSAAIRTEFSTGGSVRTVQFLRLGRKFLLDREPLRPDVRAQLAQTACSDALKINNRKFSETCFIELIRREPERSHEA
jgi:hypothetical protein